jgi:hypothetical protein
LGVLACAALTIALGGCARDPTQRHAQPPGPSRQTVVIAVAGDIACPSFDDEFNHGNGIENACQQKATARLVARMHPDAVLMLGDSQYDYARAKDYRDSYAPTWGRFLDITHAAAGNHEYARDPQARDYFEYFGPAAGQRGKGYYSFDLGAWHLVALNSNCDFVGGCTRGSPQERWLRHDLSRNARLCTLAFWHHPLFSSSEHGKAPFVHDLWTALYEYRVDVVLNGHDHVYERFGPQTPDGASSSTGIREFVVGTGGKEHYSIKHLQPHSRAHDDHTFGVLRMDLAPHSYAWAFQPVPGHRFADSGTVDCR